ncbi:MAG: hypothetical protein QM602_00785 [Microbacterium sp.]
MRLRRAHAGPRKRGGATARIGAGRAGDSHRPRERCARLPAHARQRRRPLARAVAAIGGHEFPELETEPFANFAQVYAANTDIDPADTEQLLVGDDVEIGWGSWQPATVAAQTTPLLTTVQFAITAADAGGVVLPYLLPASTDNKHFARLGIHGYGFVPLRVPHDFDVFR